MKRVREEKSITTNKTGAIYLNSIKVDGITLDYKWTQDVEKISYDRLLTFIRNLEKEHTLSQHTHRKYTGFIDQEIIDTLETELYELEDLLDVYITLECRDVEVGTFLCTSLGFFKKAKSSRSKIRELVLDIQTKKKLLKLFTNK